MHGNEGLGGVVEGCARGRGGYNLHSQNTMAMHKLLSMVWAGRGGDHPTTQSLLPMRPNSQSPLPLRW